MSEEITKKKSFFSKLSDIGSILIYEKDEETDADINVSNSRNESVICQQNEFL